MHKMKVLKFAALALAFLVCFDAGARKKKSKKASTPEVAKLTDCPVDSFSYAMGMANTQGLKNFLAARMNVDTAYMADFMEGFNIQLSETDRKRILAYNAGLQIRDQLEGQVIPALDKRITGNDSAQFLNRTFFVEGFRRTLAGDSTQMTLKDAEQLADSQMKRYQKENTERKYGDNRTQGEEFLKDNAKKDSVVTLPSGLQYKVLREGNGDIPKARSRVKVNYEGRLIDGTVFDSSYQRNEPATFGCSQVIKGWTEALTRMPVGSKWELYIPQQLGYGEREAGKIPPFSTLIFTVELLEIVK